jgi:hypothetical protein
MRRVMKTLPLVLCSVAFACGGVADPIDPPGQPPSPPTSAAPASSVVSTFAIDQLQLGDAPRGGLAPSEGAWRKYGYNLDRLKTTKDSTNVCTRASGASQVAQVDGDDGIDNGWGLDVVPLIQAGMSLTTLTDHVAAVLAAGATTLDLAVTGLPADSSSVIGAKVVATFGDAATHFDSAYVKQGTFVSGAGDAPLTLGVPFGTSADDVLALSIHDPVITFSRAPDGTIQGTIAGVLDVGEFATSASAFAKAVNPSYFAANPDAINGIIQQIDQDVDILVDGTNASGVPCTGISIGLGFTAHATQ